MQHKKQKHTKFIVQLLLLIALDSFFIPVSHSMPPAIIIAYELVTEMALISTQLLGILTHHTLLENHSFAAHILIDILNKDDFHDTQHFRIPLQLPATDTTSLALPYLILAPAEQQKPIALIDLCAHQELKHIEKACEASIVTVAHTKQVNALPALRELTIDSMITNQIAQKTNYCIDIKEPTTLTYFRENLINQLQAREDMLEHMRCDLTYQAYIHKQITHAFIIMPKLTNSKLHERVLALYELDTITIPGPYWQRTHNTVNQLQRGYLNFDGSINSDAISTQNNYAQEYIKDFMRDVGQGVIKNMHECLNQPGLTNISDAQTRGVNIKNRILFELYDNGLHGTTTISQRFKAHPLYQARLDLIKACQHYDFAAAKTIVAHSGNDQLMQRIYSEFEVAYNTALHSYKNIVFDEYGFYRACADNPLIAHLSLEQKKAYTVSPLELDRINKQALAQLHIKNKLIQAWNIPANAPACVHRALYQIIGQDAALLQKTPLLIERITAISHGNATLKQIFFLPNGILKDFTRHARATSLPQIPTILADDHAQIRMALNNLLVLENVRDTSLARYATRALDYYQTHALRLPRERIERKLLEALNDCIHHSQKPKHPVITVAQPLLQKTDTSLHSATKVGAGLCLLEIARRIYNEQTFFQNHSACSTGDAALAQPPQSTCGTKSSALPDATCGTQCPKISEHSDSKSCGATHANTHEQLLGGACTHARQEPEEWTCNHGKSQLPSFDDTQEPLDDAQEPLIVQPHDIPLIVLPEPPIFIPDLDIPSAEKKLREFIQQAIKDVALWTNDPTLQKKILATLKAMEKSINAPHCEHHKKILIKGKHIHIPEELKGSVTNAQTWEMLAKVFNGTQLTPYEVNAIQATLWPDYQHILGPEIKINCETGHIKIAGFHHDYWKALQKSGHIVFTEVKYYEHGFYSAKWSYGNVEPKFSTFFPAHWSPAKVIEKIFEALRDPITIKQQTTSYKVIGKTCEGFEIIIILEIDKGGNPTGKIISAYPDFEHAKRI